MFRMVADTSRVIRVPVHVHDRLQKLRRYRQRILLARGELPTVRECSEEMALSEPKTARLLTLLEEPESLDGAIEIERRDTADRVSTTPAEGDAAVSAQQLSNRVAQSLSALKPQQERVIRMRFGIGFDDEHTLEQIAHHMGLSRQRINQIETKALARLATGATGQGLAVFL